MWVIIHMFYASNASITSNASNYSHYSHDFTLLMWVITRIICNILNIHIIQIFEYFELNNNAMRAMRGGFKSKSNVSIQVKLRQTNTPEALLCEYMQLSIFKYSNISNLFDIRPSLSLLISLCSKVFLFYKKRKNRPWKCNCVRFFITSTTVVV